MHLRLSNAPQLSFSADRVLPLAPRDAALLAWLALEGPTSRNRLAQLLWPESEPLAARNALRQRLFQLRRQAGLDLVSGSATLSLADGVAHDLDDADRVLGDDGHDHSPEFSAWLTQQRERRRDRVRQSLVAGRAGRHGRHGRARAGLCRRAEPLARAAGAGAVV